MYLGVEVRLTPEQVAKAFVELSASGMTAALLALPEQLEDKLSSTTGGDPAEVWQAVHQGIARVETQWQLAIRRALRILLNGSEAAAELPKDESILRGLRAVRQQVHLAHHVGEIEGCSKGTCTEMTELVRKLEEWARPTLTSMEPLPKTIVEGCTPIRTREDLERILGRKL